MPDGKVNSESSIVNRILSIYHLPFTIYRKFKGFTLIELLVVISIIGILVSVVIASYGSIQKKSRDERRKSDLAEISSALILYFQDFDKYPGDIGSYPSDNSGGWIPGVSPTFFKNLPQDPGNSGTSSTDCSSEFTYCYLKNSDESFTLWTQLENEKDPDIAPNDLCDIDPKSVFGASSTLNYCLKSPTI
jgi:prepilin-type N-terminal cleavage/methylation domain-containing protein